MDHSLRLKNLNAQFISRYGFLVSNISETKQHAKDEILEHALQIGGTQNPCIVTKYNETNRRASQVADDLSVTMRNLATDLTHVTRNFFYPNVLRYQLESTELQSAVVQRLALPDALINLPDTLEDLEAHLRENADMVDRVVLLLDHEVAAFGGIMNRIRREIFTEADEIMSEYVSNMDKLIEEALQCV
ncbi:uncharacterized protein LOC129779562 [Toxorhynchites rutilus septentrionalis]|uniref:uncharacterized protein LOC129779562 n=1 Tax=Toxorhynchites rutilus septentrionalis TaxID=329112 RepID=UPI0024790E5C|nr:uncharacterized protein LOC129779562 [Toxorhynchites rutilus septentrionalis]